MKGAPGESNIKSHKLSKKILFTMASQGSMVEEKLSPVIFEDRLQSSRLNLLERKISLLEESELKQRAIFQEQSEPKDPSFKFQFSPQDSRRLTLKLSSKSLPKIDSQRSISKSSVIKLADHYPEHIYVTQYQPVQLRISAADKEFPAKFKCFDREDRKMRVYWDYNRIPTVAQHANFVYKPRSFLIEGVPNTKWLGFLITMDEGIYQHFVGCSFNGDKPLTRAKDPAIIFGISTLDLQKSSKTNLREPSLATEYQTHSDFMEIKLNPGTSKVF